MEINEITGTIIDASMRVHSQLGPGLLENVYEACLLHELRKRGLGVQAQVCVPLVYDDLRLENGLRLDLLVEDIVIVELKAVDAVLALFKAQLLSYLRLANKPVCLLINFHEVHLRDGIIRVVNGRARGAGKL